jgi:hypothetical protein
MYLILKNQKMKTIVKNMTEKWIFIKIVQVFFIRFILKTEASFSYRIRSKKNHDSNKNNPLRKAAPTVLC